MNEKIKKQLARCVEAEIPAFDDDTREITVRKKKTIKLEEDFIYIIEIGHTTRFPPITSTLAENWNSGSIPSHKYYKCDVNKIIAGQMIKVTGVAYDLDNKKDLDDVWSGWLPLNDIKVIERI